MMMEEEIKNENVYLVPDSNHIMLDEFKPVLPSEEEVGGEFYFESDSLALQNNADFQELMKTLVKLEAQRIRAVKDLECLQSVRDSAMNDPVKFVKELQSGNIMELPSPIEILDVPSIDWTKYGVDSLLEEIRPNTRKKNDDSDNLNSNNEQRKKFSRWTPQEQMKLEELLVKYPHEYVQFNRWRKISKELGNRTPAQVGCRVQKYFIALHKNNLPIPGPKPPRTYLNPKGAKVKSKRVNFCQTSLFYNSFDIKTEPEADSDTLYDNVNQEFTNNDNDNISDESDIAPCLHDSEEYRELLKLKKVKKVKRKEYITGVVEHLGFECDRCNCSPIIGTRWHCLECPPYASIDFCQNCFKIGNLPKGKDENSSHTFDHQFKPIRTISINDLQEKL